MSMEYFDYVFLISDAEDEKLFDSLNLPGADNIKVILSKSNLDDLKMKMRRDFYVIFIDYDHLDCDVNELIEIIRNYLYSLPLIVVLSENANELTREEIPNATFFETPFDSKMVHKLLSNSIRILKYNRSINDLSHFPGNFVVNDILAEKLRRNDDFVLMYLDIDKFKSFTDYYGLFRANELLRYLSERINELVEEYGNMKDFIGHVGGDDFVVIFHNYESAKIVGEKLIEDFDGAINDFYDKKDLENGYISVLSRKNVYEKFPFISLSVTTVSNEFNEYHSTQEIYEDMMAIKRQAKQFSGSVLLQHGKSN